MAFIDEYTSQDDINRFQLDQLLNNYLNDSALYTHHWIVDKDTNSWLLPIKKLNYSESLWVLHYKNTNIEIELFKTKQGGYDLISIAQNPFNNVEIISTLHEALEVLGSNSVIYTTPKKREIKEDIKKNKIDIKPKSKLKRKIAYLSILTAVIILSLFFFIFQKIDYSPTSTVATTNYRTSTKTQEKPQKNIKRKYVTDQLAFVDMDGDGLISLSILKKSSTFFEVNNNPMRTRTEWMKPNDAILVYDKNNNGKIDNINELVKDKELKNEKLYSKLQIWQDKNQDAKSQPQELKKFNIKYLPKIMTLRLEFNPAVTSKDLSTISDYQELSVSKSLPFLRGYGTVVDTNVAYNTDDDFRKLAINFTLDMRKVDNEFYLFIDSWSGYTRMQKNLKNKYNLEELPRLSDLDRKVWSYEQFLGRDIYSASIEKRLEQTAKEMRSGGVGIAVSGEYNEQAVHDSYKNLTNRYKAFFSLNAFYSDVISDALYKRDIDEYVINDLNAFDSKVASYMDSNKHTLKEKLYLAKQMKVLQKTFLHYDSNAILLKINNSEIKDQVKNEL